VFRNKDIQFNLHQILQYKAIDPQKSQIYSLAKQATLSILRD
jgi:hypothetical protein